jgi:hypothetical protein
VPKPSSLQWQRVVPTAGQYSGNRQISARSVLAVERQYAKLPLPCSCNGFGRHWNCYGAELSVTADHVVPFAPSGATDVIGRIMADRMRALLRQPVIIENVTGAAGSIGAGRIARAQPDGYMLDV